MKAFKISAAAALAVILGGVAAAQEEFPKPGPEQEQLKKLAGDWQGECKFYPPGAEDAVEFEGNYTAKLDVGGYFLISKFEGNLGGQAFQGRGMTGYDPFQKKYTGVWVDSMGPAIYHIRGEWDKAGKTYTEQMKGPRPDGKPMKMRLVTKVIDDDQLHMTMYAPGEDGKEARMMEIKYTRKKSGAAEK